MIEEIADHIEDFWGVYVIVAIVFFLLFNMISCIDTYETNKYNARKELCPNGDIVTGENIDYCDGKPMVCSEDTCSWLERNVVGEACKTMLVGKVMVRRCEEVLE